MPAKPDRLWRFFPLFVSSCIVLLSSVPVGAQTTQTVFSDDFEDGSIDETKWRENREPFESGGNEDAINATEADGVITFSGTANERWWSGISLATIPTFAASRETNLVVTVDRVSIDGSGSAYRSNVWFTDENRSRFIFFGHNVEETGWQYNRQIGLPGDNPTGSGTDVDAWNPLENSGLHQMKLIANGETVQLFVDDILGDTVEFPVREGLVFELGGYARNTNDTVTAVFDNVNIELAECAVFQQRDIVMNVGETVTASVRIPEALNSDQEVEVTVTSSDPLTTRPVSGTDGSLTLVFPAGGDNTQSFEIETLQQGAASFSLQTDADVCLGGDLFVTSPFAPGIHVEEDFSGASIDTSVWEITNQGLENGTGNFDVSQSSGTLTIEGDVTESNWGGATLKTQQGFTATEDLNLVFEVDRVSAESPTVGRTDVMIANADRSEFLAFGERLVAPNLVEEPDVPSPGWVVSSSIGDPSGSGGTVITAFEDQLDGGNHRLRLVADGERVEVFLDGESGGNFEFPLRAGLHIELGAFGELQTDSVTAVFDNAQLSTELACITSSPDEVFLELAETGHEVTVRVPTPLLEEAVSVTVTSLDPSVAVPAGATDGSLTLNFPADGNNTQTFEVATRGIGQTSFELSNDAGACNGPAIPVVVNPVPLELVRDDFSGGIDESVWQIDTTSLEDGVATDATEVIVNDQDQVEIHVVAAEGGSWPGRALLTVETFSAQENEPLAFEVDRVRHEGTLVTGTTAQQRTGLWIMDANRENFIFFFDNNTAFGIQGGWKYFQNEIQGDGTPIGPLTRAEFNDREEHQARIVADGTTVRLFLDDVFGVQLPFPISEGIRFGFGAYVLSPTDDVTGTFDNALVTGGRDPDQPTPGGGDERPVLGIVQDGNNIQVDWEDGTLQSGPSVLGPWGDVLDNGNPASSPWVEPADQQTKYFRAVVE